MLSVYIRLAWESTGRKRAARCLAYSFPWSMRFIRSRESGARWTIMVVVVVVLNFRPFHCAHRCAPPRAAVARWGTPTRSGMFTQQLDSGAVTGLLNIAELVEIVPRALGTSYRVSQQSYHLGIASGIVVQYDQEPINMNPWQLHHGPGKTVDLALALPWFTLASTKSFDSQHIHSPRRTSTYASPQLHWLSPHAPAWLTGIAFTYQKPSSAIPQRPKTLAYELHLCR